MNRYFGATGFFSTRERGKKGRECYPPCRDPIKAAPLRIAAETTIQSPDASRSRISSAVNLTIHRVIKKKIKPKIIRIIADPTSIAIPFSISFSIPLSFSFSAVTFFTSRRVFVRPLINVSPYSFSRVRFFLFHDNSASNLPRGVSLRVF